MKHLSFLRSKKTICLLLLVLIAIVANAQTKRTYYNSYKLMGGQYFVGDDTELEVTFNSDNTVYANGKKWTYHGYDASRKAYVWKNDSYVMFTSSKEDPFLYIDEYFTFWGVTAFLSETTYFENKIPIENKMNFINVMSGGSYSGGGGSTMGQTSPGDNSQSMKMVTVFIVKFYPGTGSYSQEVQNLYVGMYGGSYALFRNNVPNYPVASGAMTNTDRMWGGFNVGSYSHVIIQTPNTGVTLHYYFNIY